ncbi:sperm-associated antigen 8 [Pseudochaenichthys georgianus]|uniref:sperm-associated antigen 8 n=1 Tax=Pseudochaenichthys georgianus TaxID=52239 RepID=UPI00146DE947|nr:sperm-associated antigen 8 [Pseudochaenichthys georgianus]
MAEKPAAVGNRLGKCMLHNWVEERATEDVDTQETRTQIQKHGHKGIITMDQESQMESVTTLRANFTPPKGPGVRLRGIRGELLEKHIAQRIREKVNAERNKPSPKTDFCSTTQRDFCVQGFVPLNPGTTQVHDYKSDQAITFWSENCQRIQGATAVPSVKAPFRRSALFSTPISQRLDEMELPSDD